MFRTKKPKRPYRIGLRGSICDDGTQIVHIYLMRKRTCLYGHDYFFTDDEIHNRKMMKLAWKFLRNSVLEKYIK